MIPIAELISEEVQTFIKANATADSHTLLLKNKTIAGVPMSRIVQQMEARKKANKKLPTFYENPAIVYPNVVSVEQSSSEKLAKTKFTESIKTAIDLTGGLGVDTLALAAVAKEVVYCELVEDTFNCAVHNFKMLGVENIQFKHGDGIAYLQNTKEIFDLVYLDPSRRADDKSRVFKLEECGPNIIEQWDLLLAKGRQVMVKLSPLIDIQYLVNTLKNIESIKILAHKNDVKEVLLTASLESTKQEIAVECLNLQQDCNHLFSCPNWESRNQSSETDAPKEGQYIYLPNNAILKANLQDTVAKEHSLTKWQYSTHIYSGNELLNNYPGRVFSIEAISSFNKKELRKLLPGKKANIILKNTQLSPAELKKRMQWKDGGELYIIGGQTEGNKNVAVLAKLID